jgi:YHS domain-containing protein
MKYASLMGCSMVLMFAAMTFAADVNMPMMGAMDSNMCPKGMKMGKCCQMTMDQKMKCCGMPAAMTDRCAIMMNTPISPTDPAAIMAMKDKMKLTAEQMEKLNAITAKARQDAEAVLMPDQVEMLKGMDTAPATMRDMHKMMTQKMKEKGMMASADKSDAMGMEQTVCPVSGKPINKMYSTVYKGKTIYFCCPMCKPIFEKAAEKYLDKLPQFAQ